VGHVRSSRAQTATPYFGPGYHRLRRAARRGRRRSTAVRAAATYLAHDSTHLPQHRRPDTKRERKAKTVERLPRLPVSWSDRNDFACVSLSPTGRRSVVTAKNLRRSSRRSRLVERFHWTHWTRHRCGRAPRRNSGRGRSTPPPGAPWARLDRSGRPKAWPSYHHRLTTSRSLTRSSRRTLYEVIEDLLPNGSAVRYRALGRFSCFRVP